MDKEEAIAIALKAIDARFPGAAAGHSFDAFVRNGIWGVFVPSKSPGVLGGGTPWAKIQDADGKVLGVYLAR
ncbi:MAG TPA: hypothetical protein VGI41_01780 [Candidatus Udaeobacter sp.]